MQRTDFSEMTCSIARSLAVAGEPWSPLVLRDVWVGINRFDDLQRDLGISRKVLAERLKHLVDEGMLERRLYSARPARYEYVLTARASSSWTCSWSWPSGAIAGPRATPARPSSGATATCGTVTQIELRCAECGEIVTSSDVDVEPGPGMPAH